MHYHFITALAMTLMVTLLTSGMALAKSVNSAPPPALTQEQVDASVDALVAKVGAAQSQRIRLGVSQTASFWRAEDGDAAAFQAFCIEQFAPDDSALSLLLNRMDMAFEALGGHRIALTRTLREASDLDMGPMAPIDSLLGALDPFDHLIEDLFATKVAFAALLNFPRLTLSELSEKGASLTRDQWAAARLLKAVSLRIPGAVRQAETKAFRDAEEYISSYNIAMGCLVDSNGQKPFPPDMKLISHWGLRDEIRALYSDPAANLPKQRLIYEVMKRIILQEIPAAVVNRCELDWNPAANTVAPHNEGPQAEAKAFTASQREADNRYATLLAIFQAELVVDAWSPAFPTYIDRRFLLDRELTEQRVEALLTDVVASPRAKEVAAVIKGRLGRNLEPFDLWYDGFKNRSKLSSDLLDTDTKALYPTAQAFQKAIPSILERLGFSAQTAAYVAQHIVVDPARGSGHAMGAGMRSDSAHLRTRVAAGGMDYKGYNIAMHELGHNVEQVFSLNKVDRVLMNGVPNTAFTEAFAFLFQARDMEMLGRGAASTDSAEKANRLLDLYWSTFEISGVALLDMKVWRWMYQHPAATPAQLREAVVSMAIDLWNRYYAPVFGLKDSPVLAIYSHMIDAGLYLPDYPIGFLVSFQLERFMEGKNLGTEMERMCSQGALVPDLWMTNAVGTTLSAQPLLDAVGDALKSAHSSL